MNLEETLRRLKLSGEGLSGVESRSEYVTPEPSWPQEDGAGDFVPDVPEFDPPPAPLPSASAFARPPQDLGSDVTRLRKSLESMKSTPLPDLAEYDARGTADAEARRHQDANDILFAMSHRKPVVSTRVRNTQDEMLKRQAFKEGAEGKLAAREKERRGIEKELEEADPNSQTNINARAMMGNVKVLKESFGDQWDRQTIKTFKAFGPEILEMMKKKEPKEGKVLLPIEEENIRSQIAYREAQAKKPSGFSYRETPGERREGQAQSDIAKELRHAKVEGYDIIDRDNPPTMTSAEKVREATSASENLVAAIDRVEGLLKNASAVDKANPFSSTREQLGSAYQAALDQYRELGKLGVPSGKDAMYMDRALNDPTSFQNIMLSKGGASAQEFKETARRIARTIAKQRGYQPAGGQSAAQSQPSASGATIKETRTLDDGRVMELLSDGTKRIRK